MQATYFLVPFLSLSFKNPNLQRSSGGSRQDAAFTNACVAPSCCSSRQGAASLRLQRMNWRWEHEARLLPMYLGEQRSVWILPLENKCNKIPHPEPCLDASQKHFEVSDVVGLSDTPPALQPPGCGPSAPPVWYLSLVAAGALAP